jgi:nitrite reductase/ring-hydroxylating ferredoxin subunit
MQATPLYLADLAENSAKGFETGGVKYVAVKQNNQLYLYKNSCPHLGIPLEWHEDQFLDSSGTMIQCANHGALFVIENGSCVSGPCSGKKLTKIKFELIDDRIYLP